MLCYEKVGKWGNQKLADVERIFYMYRLVKCELNVGKIADLVR